MIVSDLQIKYSCNTIRALLDDCIIQNKLCMKESNTYRQYCFYTTDSTESREKGLHQLGTRTSLSTTGLTEEKS